MHVGGEQRKGRGKGGGKEELGRQRGKGGLRMVPAVPTQEPAVAY